MTYLKTEGVKTLWCSWSQTVTRTCANAYMRIQLAGDLFDQKTRSYIGKSERVRNRYIDPEELHALLSVEEFHVEGPHNNQYEDRNFHMTGFKHVKSVQTIKLVPCNAVKGYSFSITLFGIL
jgi:hypothetical protein